MEGRGGEGRGEVAGWELTVGLFLTPGVISSQSQKEGVRVGHTCPSFAAQSLRGLAEVQAFRPGRGHPEHPWRGHVAQAACLRLCGGLLFTRQNRAFLLTPPVPSVPGSDTRHCSLFPLSQPQPGSVGLWWEEGHPGNPLPSRFPCLFPPSCSLPRLLALPGKVRKM